jgi:valyl-tRNA synthetase
MEKQYEHQTSEARAQQKWAQEETYNPDNNPGDLYSIDTPPPTVSGSLHIGHIFSYTQADIIARYKRMSGFSVYYPFGFDDNGLPTERYVEKKRDIKAHELARSQFIALCLEETHAIEDQFVSLWKRLGLSVNWQYCYSTISDLARKLSQESFIELYNKGFIYRRHEPALFCTACRTSVAQAELDDALKPSFFNDIVFKDAQGNNLVIGTTRPELLPSCVALLYNPTDERYQHLKGQSVTVPLFDYQVPVLEDEKVDKEKGTGLVMCCTFGDKTDIEWYKKFKLPYRQSIGLDGRWVASTGFLAGLKVVEARAKVLEELKNNGLLLNQRAIEHSVNVHERCKKEIEFIALAQWFVNILDYKQQFLDAGDQVAWYPAFMKARYRDWVEHLGWDWCISRQRYFGIPFPVWHCNDCNAILLAHKTELPVDPQEKAYAGTCSHCKGSNISADTDVMDTWNTSSITPYIVKALYEKNETNVFEHSTKNAFMPMSMRPQAHDIIRTWAFDTIVKAWMHNKTIPWKSIVISGHVLSDGKDKISKSKENAPFAPENLLKTYPADVIRYWTASGSLGHDVAFSENQLKIGQRLVTKLWNAFRFAHEHLQQEEKPHLHGARLGDANQWILHNASTTFDKYKHYFEQNEFGLALQHVEQFFWNDYCDNYIELIKHQLFNPGNYAQEELAATRWTIYTVGLRILQMYAPYLPHLTEAIYESMYKQKEGVSSIHQTRFQTTQTAYVFDNACSIMQRINALVGTIRKLKTEKQVSLKTPIAVLSICVKSDDFMPELTVQEALLKGVAQAAQIRYVSTAGKTALEQENNEWHCFVEYGA